jgi:hypothetical protein
MSDPNASWHEMPGFTLPGWLGHNADEQLLDTILAGLPLPPSAPREYHVVAEQLADLARPIGPGVLPGETAALAAFSSSVSSGSLSSAARSAQGSAARASAARASAAQGNAATSGAATSGAAARVRRRTLARPSGLLTASRARIASALTVLGLVLGTTAAAYAGALPTPAQDFAHRIIGAPAAHHAGRPGPASHHPVPRSAHPSHQPPGQQRAQTPPPGKAKGHAKHPQHQKTPKPAHSPEPGSPGHRGHPPQSLNPSASS